MMCGNTCAKHLPNVTVSSFFTPNPSLTLTPTEGVEQYKYGKNRVEADAKRLQAKEEEMMKRKQDIRSRLTQLKKERIELRVAIETNTGGGEAGAGGGL